MSRLSIWFFMCLGGLIYQAGKWCLGIPLTPDTFLACAFWSGAALAQHYFFGKPIRRCG